MFKINDNYLKLPGSYLFSNIAKKVEAYSQAHPDKEIIRLGIGDVTQPLAPKIIETLHEAVDEMAHAETFHGYAPDLGYPFLRDVIAKNDYVALGAVLHLQKGSREEIKEKMDDLRRRRTEKQPLEYGSAGSTFKRPEGYFAGKLIEDAGLRGFRIGNAQVSEKHCGFVINRGGATAAEVLELMEEVSRRVEENSGVRLEPEVKKIGEF